jgi:hypothetical protein
MKVNKNILNFDWIIQIPEFELFLLLIFLPPLFYIWLFKVAQIAEKKLGRKPNKIFRIMYLVTTLSLIILILTLSIVSRITNTLESGIQYVLGILFLSFFYCDYYVTQSTFELEDQDKETYSSALPDKVYRFIMLSFLIFGAVMLQPRITEIFNNNE